MSEKIEAVAQAIAAAFLANIEGYPAEPSPQQRQAFFQSLSRAAIEAMREPTDAMIDHFGDWMGDTPQDHDDARTLWREAIDEALGPQVVS